MVVVLHPQDNVATALNDLPAGIVVSVGGQDMTVLEPVPFGHKVALKDLSVGALVVKYGFPIGWVTAPVSRGGWVHLHNLASRQGQDGTNPAPGREG